MPASNAHRTNGVVKARVGIAPSPAWLCVLLLAGCGDPPSGRTAGAGAEAADAPPIAGVGKDACALLTDAEVQGAVGHAVDSRSGGGEGSTSRCEWLLKTGSPGTRVSVEVQTEAGRERFEFVAQSAKRVAGVGDGAARIGDAAEGSYVAVAGDTLVNLQYSLPPGTADAEPLLLPLLQRVVSQLP